MRIPVGMYMPFTGFFVNSEYALITCDQSKIQRIGQFSRKNLYKKIGSGIKVVINKLSFFEKT